MQIISQQTTPLIALPNLVSNYLAEAVRAGS